MAAVSWWLAQISTKREDREERSGYKKEGVMKGGEEEEVVGLLPEAPQASKSDRDGNFFSLFLSRHVFFLSSSASIHTFPFWTVLSSGGSGRSGGCSLFTVCSGGGALCLLSLTPTLFFHPTLLFDFHPAESFRFSHQYLHPATKVFSL